MSVQRLIPEMGPLLNSGNVLFGHGKIPHSRAAKKNISDSEEANGGSALGNRWTRRIAICATNTAISVGSRRLSSESSISTILAMVVERLGTSAGHIQRMTPLKLPNLVFNARDAVLSHRARVVFMLGKQSMALRGSHGRGRSSVLRILVPLDLRSSDLSNLDL